MPAHPDEEQENLEVIEDDEQERDGTQPTVDDDDEREAADEIQGDEPRALRALIDDIIEVGRELRGNNTREQFDELIRLFDNYLIDRTFPVVDARSALSIDHQHILKGLFHGIIEYYRISIQAVMNEQEIRNRIHEKLTKCRFKVSSLRTRCLIISFLLYGDSEMADLLSSLNSIFRIVRREVLDDSKLVRKVKKAMEAPGQIRHDWCDILPAAFTEFGKRQRLQIKISKAHILNVLSGEAEHIEVKMTASMSPIKTLALADDIAVILTKRKQDFAKGLEPYPLTHRCLQIVFGLERLDLGYGEVGTDTDGHASTSSAAEDSGSEKLAISSGYDVKKLEKELKSYISNRNAVIEDMSELLHLYDSEQLISIMVLVNHDCETAIHCAAERGHMNSIRWMLDDITSEQSYDLLCKQSLNGETAMHCASRRGHANIVKWMLVRLPAGQTESLLKVPDTYGATAIDSAVVYGQTKAIQCILNFITKEESYRILKIENKMGDTAINNAAITGRSEIIGILLENMSDEHRYNLLNIQNEKGSTAVNCAAREGHEKVVKCILNMVSAEQKYVLLMMKDANGDTALNCAVIGGYKNVVKCILDSISQEQRYKLLTEQDSDDDTAVNSVVTAGYKEIIACMLESILPDQRYNLLKMRNKTGNTAINIAAREGYKDIIQCIMDNVSEDQRCNLLMMQNKIGNSAITIATRQGNTDVVQLILECISPDQRFNLLSVQNSAGDAGISIAARKGHTDLVKCILDSINPDLRCALLKLQNEKGQTAVSSAVLKGHRKVVDCMLSSIPQDQWYNILQIRNQKSNTAVACAAMMGHQEIITSLLGSISPNQCYDLLKIPGNEGETAILAAARSGHTNIIKYMLEFLTPDQQLEILPSHDCLMDIDFANMFSKAAVTSLQKYRHMAEEKVIAKSDMQDQPGDNHGTNEEELPDINFGQLPAARGSPEIYAEQRSRKRKTGAMLSSNSYPRLPSKFARYGSSIVDESITLFYDNNQMIVPFAEKETVGSLIALIRRDTRAQCSIKRADEVLYTRSMMLSQLKFPFLVFIDKLCTPVTKYCVDNEKLSLQYGKKRLIFPFVGTETVGALIELIKIATEKRCVFMDTETGDEYTEFIRLSALRTSFSVVIDECCTVVIMDTKGKDEQPAEAEGGYSKPSTSIGFKVKVGDAGDC